MERPSKNAVVGFSMLAAGAGLLAAGAVVLAPVCFSWSRNIARNAYEKGRQSVLAGIDGATARLKDVAEKTQGPLSDAAKAARQTTAIAAGAVETAAHYIKERVQ
jgi:hypothetical protein